MGNLQSESTPVYDRSTKEVFENHLALRGRHDVETDIETNYARDVILLTGSGIYRGHEGVRQSAQVLNKKLPNGRYEYRTRLVDGELTFLEWTGQSAEGKVNDGADSFVVRNGKIVMQTIHYTVETDKGNRFSGKVAEIGEMSE